jgi:hypothetical protein
LPLPPVVRDTLEGTLDGTHLVRITSAYVRAFCDTELLGLDSPLLKGPSSDYPEVSLSSRPS